MVGISPGKILTITAEAKAPSFSTFSGRFVIHNTYTKDGQKVDNEIDLEDVTKKMLGSDTILRISKRWQVMVANGEASMHQAFLTYWVNANAFPSEQADECKDFEKRNFITNDLRKEALNENTDRYSIQVVDRHSGGGKTTFPKDETYFTYGEKNPGGNHWSGYKLVSRQYNCNDGLLANTDFIALYARYYTKGGPLNIFGRNFSFIDDMRNSNHTFYALYRA